MKKISQDPYLVASKFCYGSDFSNRFFFFFQKSPIQYIWNKKDLTWLCKIFVNGCVIHVKSLEKHVEPQRNKIDLTPGQAGGN